MTLEKLTPRQRGRFRPRTRRRGGFHAVLLRRLPRESLVHRLAISTKVIGLLTLTIATGLNTGWSQLAGVTLIVLLTVIAARVPLRAVPRLPPWFAAIVLIGFALAAAGGGAGRFVRLMSFSLLFTALSLVIAWTTDLSELAPALARLASPLRRLRLPVDDWAVTAALSIRCLPLIIEEIRTVLAAHRLRAGARDPTQLVHSIADVITASMAASIRRASDLGEVLALRGGPGAHAAVPLRLHARDLVALTLVAAASLVPGIVF